MMPGRGTPRGSWKVRAEESRFAGVADAKEIVRRLTEAIWNEGDLSVVDELLDPEYVGYDPAVGTLTGREAFRRFVGTYRAAFPDLALTIQDLLGEGDAVALRWTLLGTHEGELMGIPPTGKQIVATGITIARLKEGRVAVMHTSRDTLGLLRQLGVVDAPTTVGA